MDIKRRSGFKGSLTNPGSAPRNAVSSRKPGESQAKPIKNTSGGSPRSVGVSAPRFAVNKPNQS